MSREMLFLLKPHCNQTKHLHLQIVIYFQIKTYFNSCLFYIFNIINIFFKLKIKKGLHAHLTTQWVNFNNNHIAAGTIPDRQALFDLAKELDDNFGHLFNPPIR